MSMSRELDPTLRTAVKGTTLIFVGTAAGNLLWFAIKVLIVRNLRVEEFGLYSLCITIAGMLTSVSLLGTTSGTTRHISTFRGQDRAEDARSQARASLHVSLASSLMFGILLFALAGPMARHVFYKPEMAALIRVLSLVLPLNAMSASLGAILQGHGEVRQKVYFQDVGLPLYYLVLLGVVLVIGFSLMNVIYAFTLAAALTFASMTTYEYGKLGISPLPLRKGLHYRVLLGFSLPLLVADVSGLVLNWTDTLMLGRYTPPESVGIYNVAMSLARLLTFVLVAMGFVFFPMATEMHARGLREELKRNYQVLTKWVFAATFPLFFILFFFPETTIAFLFGAVAVEASTPLRILALGFLFHVFLGTNGMLVMAMGMTKAIMRISLFGAGMNVVLNYILIKRLDMGVTGASAATLVSYAVINGLVSIVLYRASGIHPFTAKYLKPLAGASVIGLLIYALAKGVAFSFWLMPVYLVLFVVGYGLSLLFSGSLDMDDMALFEAISERTGLRLEWMRRILNRFAHE
jgi:O-antigen/teichoic acid export membrane protein